MITLDRRAGSYELSASMPLEIVRIGHLEFGDASFMGNGPGGPVLVGVERKTVRDLLHSTDSGRLQGHQIPGLLRSYNYVYIVVEGIFRSNRDGILEYNRGGAWYRIVAGKRSYMASSLYNLMNTLSLLSGIVILQTQDSRTTANLITNLYRWWQKPWSKHTGHVGFQIDPHPVELHGKPSLLRRMAKELPGIGWEKSKAVAEHFKTVRGMVLADRFNWQLIEGIGPTIAKRCVEVMREEDQ